MDDRNDILSKVFRNRLKNYKEEPDTDLWSKIEGDLSSVSGRKIHVWKWIGTVAAVAVILLAIFISNNHNPHVEQTISKVIIPEISNENPQKEIIKSEPGKDIKDKPDDLQNVSKENNYLAQTHSRPLSVNQKKAEEKNKKEVIEIEKAGLGVKDGETDKNKSETVEIENLISEKKDKKENDEHTVKHEELSLVADTSPEEWNANSVIKKSSKNKTSLALAMGNFRSNSSGIGGDYMTSYEQLLTSESNLNFSIVRSDDAELINTDFSNPISVGFYIRKVLSEKWAVESGLTYTYLASNETYRLKDKTQYEKDIHLHYLGVPVKMVYSFINNNRFSMYASAGGMVEKSISGKEKLYTDTETTSHSLNISELQLSLSGSIGFNYQLIDHLGIYLEPGFSYYFDDNSDVNTIRKDTPFGFQILGGLRLIY